MANDGQVIIEITADNRKALQSVHDVTDEIQREGKKWDQSASESTDKIGGAFSGMLSKVAAGFAAAKIGQALISFSTDAIEVASSLEEVQNVVDTTFGDGAAKIEEWASKAGSQFGLTELQAKKFTSTLGAMMKSAGLAGPEIVQMSTDLSGLAADMASFYNLDFEEAFQKIRAGISGETEPLKQLGVNMSVANLEAFALAQGLDKTFNSMSQGEQTMLRYQYLMQATADAQGDFAKTADGFENAKRRIDTAVTQIKSIVGTSFLNVIGDATAKVAEFLEEMTAKPPRTVLDDINDIEIDTAGKMANLQETAAQAQAVIDLLAQIEATTYKLKDGTTVTFAELFTGIADVEKNGGDVKGYIESLGLDVDDVITKYNQWKEGTRQLTSLIPSLTSVINEETGAVEGGTSAIQKNKDEFVKAEQKKYEWAAYYAKARALEEAKAGLYKYQFDAQAKAQLRKNFEAEHSEIVRLYKEKGGLFLRDATDWGVSREEADAYIKIIKDEKDAADAYTKQADAIAQVEETLTAGKQALIEKWGEEEEAIEDAGDAADYAGKSAEEWTEALKDAPQAAKAIQAVVDYYNKVRDATEQTVNSTIKGFERIKTAWDEYAQLSTDETDVLNKYGDVWNKWGSSDDALKNMAENVDKLTDREREAYEALVKIRNAQIDANEAMNQYRPEGMKASLESQLTFMENYLKNIQKLKEWGVSDDLIASLSDGSVESANYLAGLAQGGKDAAIEVGELYDQVTEKKKGFVDALTEQKLTADEAFGSLLEVARDAVEALDLGEEAANAMGDTVLGIASGIASNVPEVGSAVADLMNALNPLTALGFSWGFSDGSFTLDVGNVLGNILNGEFETGLDRVPFDGFLASLHEGEGILTAEENRIWQRFKNGDASHGNVDYETLGGVMRDNVHAGGNVYLDGRTVGQVVSGIQGRSYRNLQRSGWQG
jgi:hypothetical protein